MQEFYREHLQTLTERYREALAKSHWDRILLHSGSLRYHFADDRAVHFEAEGHFCQWLPINRADQFVLIDPDGELTYFCVLPNDYWHDQRIELSPWWADSWRIETVSDPMALRNRFPSQGTCYWGDAPLLAEALGIEPGATDPQRLIAHLNYFRAVKTEYELAQIRAANRRALPGHVAARQCFEANGSEFDIHLAYLKASGQLEEECPYTNIVALDEHAAILHYQHKQRTADEARVLLIDAGARVNNYCSDITRTNLASSACEEFRELHAGIAEIQEEIIRSIKPGIDYTNLHLDCLFRLGDLLLRIGLVQGSREEVDRLELSQLFMPHGLGHFLGVQVHDVGGRQADVEGRTIAPPEHSPALRTTRNLLPDMVVTIEPGCYFIPQLLDPERNTARGARINWQLVDRLKPYGGIRIEDNIRVTRQGSENLTRAPETPSLIQ